MCEKGRGLLFFTFTITLVKNSQDVSFNVRIYAENYSGIIPEQLKGILSQHNNMQIRD
jgi:hypothetical protein